MNFYDESRSTARFYAASVIITAILIFASVNVVVGQARSEDRDNPAPITSNKIIDELDGSASQYFYKFTAGPGKLTVTFEVKASGTNAGAMLDLFVNSRPILSDVLAQGVDGGTERQVNSVQLSGRREVVMRIKGLKYGDSGGTGAYSITLDGPVTLAQEAAPTPAAAPAPAAAPDRAPAPAPAPGAGNGGAAAAGPPVPNDGGAAASDGPNSVSGQLNPEADRKQRGHQWRVIAPGVVTFKFSVKATDKNAGATFVVLDARGVPVLAPIQLQGVGANPESFSTAVAIPSAQTITILLQPIAYGTDNGRGTYSLQLSGPVQVVPQ